MRPMFVPIVATILATAGLASAQTGAGPDLTPPTEMPSSSVPAPAPAVKTPRQRAVLAVPGMIRSTPARPAAPDPLPAVEAPGTPPLDAPAEMPAAPRPKTNGAGRATVIESSPIDDPSAEDSPAARPGATRRTTVTPPKIVDTPTPPQPTRRGRFFGLLLPAPTPPPATTRATSPTGVADDLTLIESPLKLRIEKQARDAIGDRARSVEVKMTGKKLVAIQAKGVKFYQKRAVRKAIEALPALSGMRSTIDVLD